MHVTNFWNHSYLECGGCSEKNGANICTENGCQCGSVGDWCDLSGPTPRCLSANDSYTQNDASATCKVKLVKLKK